MVKGFNEVWCELCRKDSEITIRYQYKQAAETSAYTSHGSRGRLPRLPFFL